MATRGYNVYTFKLRKNGKEDLPQGLDEHRLRLRQCLADVGLATRVGKPPRLGMSPADGLEETPLPAVPQNNTLSVRGAAYSSDFDVVHADIALGERGLHDYAVKPETQNDRISVSDRAAETPRRVDFFFAKSGYEGFLVAELVGRKDPIRILIKWLTYMSRERMKKFNSSFQGDDPSLPDVPYYTVVEATRVSDPAFLQSLLDDVRRMDARFIETNKRNREVNRQLEIRVRDRDKMSDILNRLKHWSDADEPRLIRETLENLDIDPENLGEANLALNELKVRIEGRDGRQKTLVPNKISDLFTYVFESPVRLMNSEYYAIVAEKLDELKVPASIPFEGYGDVTSLVNWVSGEEAEWARVTEEIRS